MNKPLILGTLAVAMLAGAAAPAVADGWRRGWHGHRHWGPPPRVYHAPRPRVYYAPPPPVYYAPPPVVYAPPPVYYAPPSVSLGINIPLR